MIHRIAITGPESTGKSWLAEQLARHYGEPWVPEYSREYLEKLGRPYEMDDILYIAAGQFNAENELIKSAEKYIFSDTEFLVTYIWSMVKYGEAHSWLNNMATTHRYSHYLLCNTDLPWEFDPLREHPHYRDELLKLYIRELEERKLPYTLISGAGEERLQNAIRALKDAGLTI